MLICWQCSNPVNCKVAMAHLHWHFLYVGSASHTLPRRMVKENNQEHEGGLWHFMTNDSDGLMHYHIQSLHSANSCSSTKFYFLTQFR